MILFGIRRFSTPRHRSWGICVAIAIVMDTNIQVSSLTCIMMGWIFLITEIDCDPVL